MGAAIVEPSANAYHYERFPTVKCEARNPISRAFTKFVHSPPDFIPDTEVREQIEIRAGKYYRALRPLKTETRWPRDHTALALELNEIALEEAEVNPIQAYRTFRAALRQDNNVPEIWNNLGLSYLETGDLDAAEFHFRKALEIDKELATAWGNLGLTYLESGQYLDAWRQFTKAIKIDANDPLHLNNLGVLYLELSDPNTAKELFESTIAADPEFHLAYYNLGIATAMQGLYEEADKYYSQGRQVADRRAPAFHGVT